MRTLALLGAGFGLWACGLVAVYSALSVGCELSGDPGGAHPLERAILLVLALATVAAIALVAWCIAKRRKREHDAPGPQAFVLEVAFHASVAATAAAAFTFSGLTLLPTCG